MTGTGHHLSTLAAGAILVAVDPTLTMTVTAVTAIAAASLPDSAEIARRGFDGRRASIIPHRTITHWPAIWIALAFVAYLSPSLGLVPSGLTVLFAAALYGVAFGGLFHCFIDIFSPMGIPLLTPFGKRTALGPKPNTQGAHLYTTGRWSETSVVIGLLALAAGSWFLRFGPAGAFLAGLAHHGGPHVS